LSFLRERRIPNPNLSLPDGAALHSADVVGT
jgi:hypothetical protein